LRALDRSQAHTPARSLDATPGATPPDALPPVRDTDHANTGASPRTAAGDSLSYALSNFRSWKKSVGAACVTIVSGRSDASGAGAGVLGATG